jgi:hypothetical protein
MFSLSCFLIRYCTFVVARAGEREPFSVSNFLLFSKFHPAAASRDAELAAHAPQRQRPKGIGGFEVEANATEVGDHGRKLRERRRNLRRASRFGRDGHRFGVTGHGGRSPLTAQPQVGA